MTIDKTTEFFKIAPLIQNPLMKTLTIDMVKFTLDVEPEHISIEKELSLKNTGVDYSEYINKVKRNRGRNPWLWGAVTVTAEFKGLTASTHLACCAYGSEKDFINEGVYYEQMKSEAFEGLKKQVDEIVNALQ